MANVCKKCKAPIRWAVTGNGSPIPLDPEPNPAGNVRLTERCCGSPPAAEVLGKARQVAARAGREVLYMPHHATCEFADDFR
jgi:hypothetical protein